MSDGPTKAELVYESTSGAFQHLKCMFNPNELGFHRSNSFSQAKVGSGLGAPAQIYSGTASASWDIQLVFDTTDTGKSVKRDTAKLMKLMDLQDFKGEKRPPMVQLVWGTHFETFMSFITSIKVSYIYFGADGMPLRARAEVGFVQAWENPAQSWSRQNPTSGTPEPHGTHQIQTGETLDRIAARHYGDSTQWRLIAQANGIGDPLAIRPGRVLTIPKL